MKFIICE